MLQILYILQIIISILVSITVLLQNKGTGLSATFGGDFSGFHTKRGFEKFLVTATTVLGALFIINAFVIFVVSTTS